MKMLCIHCDYFYYIATKKTRNAETLPDECKSCVARDALVLFLTAEKYDEKDLDKVVLKSMDEITRLTKQLGMKSIILFPFAHLSEELSDPDTALRLIESLHSKLKIEGYNVTKAPFGWEKIFSLTSKGHPLAETLKTVRPD